MVRGYQVSLRLFVELVCNRRYGWPEVCQRRFGQEPTAVLHEWNSMVHAADFEGRPGRRPLTYDEVQVLFDAADGRVAQVRRRRSKGATAAARDSAQPQGQLVARVAVTGLPDAVTAYRHDSLGGTATTAAGRRWYALPRSDQELHAHGLGQFVLWAQEVFTGDVHPGWWGQFQPVLPQGTGPLEAAAFAAAALTDGELVEHLIARVENEQASEHYFDDFLAEIRQLHPQAHQLHPITRPIGG